VKPVKRSKTFEKHFKKRISPSSKLVDQFEERLKLFMLGIRDYPLDDHSLMGKLAGKRAFSVANDVRVVYIETDDTYTFIDIGSHNQVYGS
jgi:addiction module RelE/StbE family toxin